MTRRRARLLSLWLLFHFLLILVVSIRETFWALAEGQTKAPALLQSRWQTAAAFAGTLLGEKLNYRSPVRQVLQLYLQSAGIEGGYGYFAPDIPDGCRLSFEVRYPDGRIEYDLPHVNSTAAGLRVASLLDRLTRPGYFPLREYAMRLFGQSIWRHHPDSTAIHAVFDSIQLPGLSEYQNGMRESYETLCEYDFSPRKDSAKSPR